jgi:hypothetical protein
MSEIKDFYDTKWKALEQEQFTDCSFLVGAEEGKTEVFFSSYFLSCHTEYACHFADFLWN